MPAPRRPARARAGGPAGRGPRTPAPSPDQAPSTRTTARTISARNTRLTNDPREAEQPAPAVDRHPRPRRAPDPERRVGGRDEQQRGGDEHAHLDEQAVEARAELERGDRDRPEHERGRREQDVVLLERGRGGLGDAARREAAEARGQRCTRRRRRARLDRQPGTPSARPPADGRGRASPVPSARRPWRESIESGASTRRSPGRVHA